MSLDIQEIFTALEETNSPLFEQVSYGEVATGSLTPMNTKDNNKVPGAVIASAKDEVLIQSYKYDIPSEGHDEISKALKSIKEKARVSKKPVTVNILLNKRGAIPERIFKPNASGDLRDNFPENDEFFKVNLSYHQAEAFGSYHSKLIIVDSETAIVRGGEASKYNRGDEGLLETGTLIKGAFANEVRNDFVRSWNKICDKENKMEPKETQSVKSSEANIPIAFISKKANGNPLLYTNDKGPLKVALLKAINSSKKSIKIITPNLNDPDVIKALADACDRNVEVQILMSKKFNDDIESMLGGTNSKSVQTLVKLIDRTKSHNLKVHWSTRKNGEITEKKGESNEVHGKFACFDDRVVITGSTPLDVQGTYYSKEADIIFQDEQTAAQFNEKLFSHAYKSGKDFREHAYQSIQNIILSNIKDKHGERYADINTLVDRLVYSKAAKKILSSGEYSDRTKAKVLVSNLRMKLKSSLDTQQYKECMDLIQKNLSFCKVKPRNKLNFHSSELLQEQKLQFAVFLLTSLLLKLVCDSKDYVPFYDFIKYTLESLQKLCIPLERAIENGKEEAVIRQSPNEEDSPTNDMPTL
ncbi:MAG: phosphatidylserine/phosphatidylglycerophosphate/cardiolipin synthase family protein [Legionellaceae bacterium]|nr:phosphatidylserine/phosphatidylglycerophosphate/cardiolipin synthase family protein [Legionellaceae bacterium]